MDWDDAYANMAHIPGSEAFPAMWSERAAAYRNRADFAQLDIAYGATEREKLDLFKPDGAAKGLVMFVHGGYWMKLDKSFWSDLAEGARANGWAVAMPSYTLAPQARISHMTRQIAHALTKAASLVNGPIRICGHSAGGHLVSRMACSDVPLDGAAAERLEHVLSISGLHDLRPLLNTKMNETLHLDDAEAAEESAGLKQPRGTTPVTCWVGADERPEFLRQNQLLVDAWKDQGIRIKGVIDKAKHHFTVIDPLADPASPIVKSLLDL